MRSGNWLQSCNLALPRRADTFLFDFSLRISAVIINSQVMTSMVVTLVETSHEEVLFSLDIDVTVIVFLMRLSVSRITQNDMFPFTFKQVSPLSRRNVIGFGPIRSLFESDTFAAAGAGTKLGKDRNMVTWCRFKEATPAKQ